MDPLLTMPAVLCVAVASATAQQPVGHWDFRQQAVVVVGEMEATAVPCYAGDYFGFIDPARDWHKTPLLEIEK